MCVCDESGINNFKFFVKMARTRSFRNPKKQSQDRIRN